MLSAVFNLGCSTQIRHVKFTVCVRERDKRKHLAGALAEPVRVAWHTSDRGAPVRCWDPGLCAFLLFLRTAGAAAALTRGPVGWVQRSSLWCLCSVCALLTADSVL